MPKLNYTSVQSFPAGPAFFCDAAPVGIRRVQLQPSFSALRWATGAAVAITTALLVLAIGNGAEAADKKDFSPSPDERQLPRVMHSEMKDRPTITVGLRDADIIGTDNRALQAAVDYIAGLGGGVVEIGPGEFSMHDSLHLRASGMGCSRRTLSRITAATASPSAIKTRTT